MNKNTMQDNVIVKFSYLGSQNKSISSLLFLNCDSSEYTKQFVKHNVFYQNDEMLLIKLRTTSVEQEAIIEAVKKHKSSTADIELSIVLLNINDDSIDVYKLNRDQSVLLYNDIYKIIESNATISEAVGNWGNATRFSAMANSN